MIIGRNFLVKINGNIGNSALEMCIRDRVGDDRLAPRLDLLDVGIHRAVQVAGVLHHLAALAFAGLLALVEALVGLADRCV